MSSGPNPILGSANTYLSVTNFAGYTGTALDGSTLSLKAASFIPLTTSDGSATGQIVVAVRAVGTSPPPGGGTFTSNVALATSSGNIPAGSYGWSATAISGTITVGGASLPVGASVGGGGYTGYTLGSAVAYTVSSGSVLIVYDN